MFLLIGVSMMAALFFLILFIWSLKTGQFEDMVTPSMRDLFDYDVFFAKEMEEESKSKLK